MIIQSKFDELRKNRRFLVDYVKYYFTVIVNSLFRWKMQLLHRNIESGKRRQTCFSLTLIIQKIHINSTLSAC